MKAYMVTERISGDKTWVIHHIGLSVTEASEKAKLMMIGNRDIQIHEIERMPTELEVQILDDEKV